MSSWNRKYRPQTVAGLHLTVVRDQLQTFISAGQLPQVFVFAGPKGTGKTSAARILGALVNNPKNEQQVKSLFFTKSGQVQPLIDEVQPDLEMQKVFQGNSFLVQELDAASNRGIDDVRALKERVSLPPSFGLVSVYILDEAHMLTTEAFNALLKLLEEPPPHALFILATTEKHKIPETIVSRAQVVAFAKASADELTHALEQVLKKEAITYEKEAVEAIAIQADGSFRDAIKVLESVAQTGSVTLERLSSVGVVSYEQQVNQLLNFIIDKNEAGIVALFQELRQQNVQETYFHVSLLKLLHLALQQSLGIVPGKAVVSFEISKFLLSELSTSALSEASPLPLLQLEMKILNILARSKKKPTVGNSPSSEKPEKNKELLVKKSSTIVETARLTTKADILHTLEPSISDFKVKGDGTVLVDQWLMFVERMTARNPTIAALLRSAQPVSGAEGAITVKVYYKFHREQLKSQKFNQIIRACAEEMIEGTIEFTFIVEEPILATDVTDVSDLTELSSIATQALL